MARKLLLQGRRYQLPGGWDELSARQLAWLCQRVLRGQRGQTLQLGLVLDMVGARVVREATGRGVYLQLSRGRQLYQVDSAQLRDLAGYADYLYDRYGALQCQLMQLPRGVVPEVLKGYEPGFYDVQLDEFLYSEDLRQALYATPRHDGAFGVRLCQWLGVLHRVRVQGREGQARRLPLDRQTNAQRGALVATLQPWQRLAMVWAYEASLAHVAAAFPDLFSTDPGERGLPRTKGLAVGLIYALCGDQLAQLPVVRGTNLWDALYYLQALEARRAHEAEG